MMEVDKGDLKQKVDMVWRCLNGLRAKKGSNEGNLRKTMYNHEMDV